jgi:plasmid stabilization system protein ParE
MRKCTFSVPARNDLKEINYFIANNNPEAARRLKDKIRQQCLLLAKFPNMGLLTRIFFTNYVDTTRHFSYPFHQIVSIIVNA